MMREAIGKIHDIYKAIQEDDISMLETIDISHMANSHEFLHLAATHGSARSVKFFIEKGANVNQTDYWNITPLSHAIVNLLYCHPKAQQNFIGSLYWLITGGANIDILEAEDKNDLLNNELTRGIIDKRNAIIHKLITLVHREAPEQEKECIADFIQSTLFPTCVQRMKIYDLRFSDDVIDTIGRRTGQMLHNCSLKRTHYSDSAKTILDSLIIDAKSMQYSTTPTAKAFTRAVPPNNGQHLSAADNPIAEQFNRHLTASDILSLSRVNQETREAFLESRKHLSQKKSVEKISVPENEKNDRSI